ncbi:MAG: cupin domain-containing protein [Candidatus Cloacimonetes bacterium]|nr:cupin domain-containing protein [Candidatus Cloacimonadota bacterium]
MNLYPEMISKLPEIEIPIKGITGWLLENSTTQTVFFEIDTKEDLPSHAHCAQWGIMVDGVMELTIGGKPEIFTKGSHYYIPEGVIHSAKFLTKVYVIDVFDSPDRYKIKK